jgi:hypothetical protein
MPVGDPVMFSGRLKTRLGLAGNQNLPFLDGHKLDQTFYLLRANSKTALFFRNDP